MDTPNTMRLKPLIISTISAYPAPLLPLAILRRTLPTATREQVDRTLESLSRAGNIEMVRAPGVKMSSEAYEAAVYDSATGDLYVSVRLA